MGILYSKLKIFHEKEKIDSLPAEKSRILPPVHVRVKPTNVCNHGCSYCSYRRDNTQLGKDMVKKDQIPREKMLEIVADFADMGVKAVTFSGGGEPLVYPHIIDTIEALSRTDIRFATLTNGARLSGDVARIFSERATWIRVSLDGWDGASYASYRGVPESEFGKVMDNLENFMKLGGKCYTGVVCIVDGRNAPHVYEIVKRISSTGVNSMKIAPCILSNEEEENRKFHEPFAALVQEQVDRAVSDYGREGFEISCSYASQLQTFRKSYEWCPYLQINPVVGADLNVYSCHDKAYNLDQGMLFSIKDRRFREAWFSDKSNFFRINPAVMCNHHCMANEGNKLIHEYLGLDEEHRFFA